jgi:hypothetical protein
MELVTIELSITLASCYPGMPMLMTLYRGFLKAMQPELGSEGFDFLVDSARYYSSWLFLWSYFCRVFCNKISI